jgi:flagellar hook-basal body complex protein FliE
MNRVGVDPAGIERILEQLRAAQARMQGGVPGNAAPKPVAQAPAAAPSDFASALKTSLDQVNSLQVKATEATRLFELDPKNTNLHEVMITTQKAQISFQATLQFRNKVVQAYQDIMNMQI